MFKNLGFYDEICIWLRPCFTRKPFRPCLLRIFEFSLVESVVGPILGLHEVSFGPEPITSSLDEKSTCNGFASR